MAKKWDLFEQYETQGEKFADIRAKYEKKEREAGENIGNLKAQYDALISQELREGKDLTAKKDSTRKELADAHHAYELAQMEHHKALDFTTEEAVKSAITVGDLAQDYITNYVPEARKADVQPIIDRIHDARSAYYNALIDLFELRSDYNNVYRTINDMVRTAAHNGQLNPTPHIMHPVELRLVKLISDEELFQLENYRKLPSDVKRGA